MLTNHMLPTRVIPQADRISAPLLEWLNRAKQSSKDRRAFLFTDLAQRLQKVERKRNYPRAKLVRTSAYKPTTEQTSNLKERIRLVRQINALIHRVVPKTIPRIDCWGGKWIITSARRRRRVGFVFQRYV